ncbi:MAG TPA: S41 family peptidase [Thermoanaerobaculia bacterium]|nr:S41 family peptidase [Thermoanaerobaculia bacterium]
MNRSTGSRVLFLIASAMLVVPLLSGGLVGARTRADGADDFYEYLSVFTDVLSLVRKVYVERVDGRTLLSGALDGASDALDPFSVYVPAEEVEGYRAAQRVGRTHSGMEVVKERGVAFVIAVEPESPAARAGVSRDDIVSKLAGRSTRDMPLWRMRQLFGGAPGTELELELVRRGEAIPVVLELARYQPPAPALESFDDIAVLRIPRFEPAAVAAVAELVAQAEGSTLLLDLRGVSGGEPEAAYRIADLFVDGELGKLIGRDGELESFVSRQEDVWPGELAVLVDRGTQGPAEVLARVLQGAGRAVTVGQRSFGHAGRTAQIKLSSGALLELTDGFYSGPDGVRIDESIVPELRVEQLRRDEEGVDAVLDEALRLLRESRQEKAAA